MIVVAPPEMQLPASVGQGEEHFHVQTFVSQLAVEAFDIAVLNRLARPDEVQMHTVSVRPEIQRLRGELRAIVHRDRLRCAAQHDHLVEGHRYLFAAQPAVRMQAHTPGAGQFVVQSVEAGAGIASVISRQSSEGKAASPNILTLTGTDRGYRRGWSWNRRGTLRENRDHFRSVRLFLQPLLLAPLFRLKLPSEICGPPGISNLLVVAQLLNNGCRVNQSDVLGDSQEREIYVRLGGWRPWPVAYSAYR